MIKNSKQPPTTPEDPVMSKLKTDEEDREEVAKWLSEFKESINLCAKELFIPKAVFHLLSTGHYNLFCLVRQAQDDHNRLDHSDPTSDARAKLKKKIFDECYGYFSKEGIVISDADQISYSKLFQEVDRCYDIYTALSGNLKRKGTGENINHKDLVEQVDLAGFQYIDKSDILATGLFYSELERDFKKNLAINIIHRLNPSPKKPTGAEIKALREQHT